jgi:uncharacterized protein
MCAFYGHKDTKMSGTKSTKMSIFEKIREIMYIIMPMMPIFPEFKPIEIDDKDVFRQHVHEYQPNTSEINFTNLFIWRNHYEFRWSMYDKWLLVIGANSNSGVQALPPIGPSPRLEVMRQFCLWIAESNNTTEPHIDRADVRLTEEVKGNGEFVFNASREHFDYVYHTSDLIHLAGKGYRQKRNHLNHLFRTYPIVYKPMDESDVPACLAIADQWCKARRCSDDLNLAGEWEATREAIIHFRALGAEGGVIIINGQVEAFTIGELLNKETAVVHIEKANMDIRGLYAVVNQQFCEKQWKDLPWINREQDLGELGLRKAKLSYNPDRLEEKYQITMKIAHL